MKKIIMSCCLFAATSMANAAVLDVQNGNLMGANNVIVNGTSYNVQFVDGACATVFSGCDAADDFTFSTLADAALASQALLDQVFLDGSAGSFDSNPSWTNGIWYSNIANILTAFELDSTSIFTSVTRNTDDAPVTCTGLKCSTTSKEGPDLVVAGTTIITDPNITSSDTYVWAKWSQADTVAVPNPGTMPLLALGVLAMSFLRRQR